MWLCILIMFPSFFHVAIPLNLLLTCSYNQMISMELEMFIVCISSFFFFPYFFLYLFLCAFVLPVDLRPKEVSPLPTRVDAMLLNLSLEISERQWGFHPRVRANGSKRWWGVWISLYPLSGTSSSISNSLFFFFLPTEEQSAQQKSKSI